LLLVNSSDSSDCEDHESASLHHNHQELARLHHDRLAVVRPGGSRNHSAERPHDPFSNNSVAGSDVVDELLKPLQSYFSVFRTGVYDHGGSHGLLDGDLINGPPAHNTRSHDKRYKIRKNQQDGRKRHEMAENGVMHHHAMQQQHHHQQQQAGMHPPQAGMHPNQPGMPMPPPQGMPPPAVTNGYHNQQGGQPRLENMETEISQLPPPNLNEPPPNIVQNPTFPPPRPMMMMNQMSGPPPPVMMSPPANTPMFSTPTKEDPRQEQLENDISNLSIREGDNTQKAEHCPEVDLTTQVPEEVEPEPVSVTTISKDLFSLYSLSFVCKAKDLSERRIKLDFGLVAEAYCIRGQLGRVEAPILVSFQKEEDAINCVNSKNLQNKYPALKVAPSMRVVPDKDGYYSIEFVNTGMSGVREITNDFSRHGELVKVHQGGAKNAVKRVTVSYTDIESAMNAITAYANDKDVRGIDFVPECLEFLG